VCSLVGVRLDFGGGFGRGGSSAEPGAFRSSVRGRVDFGGGLYRRFLESNLFLGLRFSLRRLWLL